MSESDRILLSNQQWHTLSSDNVVNKLNTDIQEGLSTLEVKLRHQKYGNNTIPAVEQRSAIQIFLIQFKNLPIALLLVASVLSLFLGRIPEAIAILAVVFMTVIFGFFMEKSAQRAISSLIVLRSPKAKVLRNGEEKEINASDLVPGDIIEFASGDKIPADSRLIDSFGVIVDESPLTGESHGVLKNADILTNQESDLTDRKNMCYMGTLVLEGTAKAVVTTIGKETEVGKIENLLQGVEIGKTPLEHKIEHLGKILVIAVFAITALYITIGYFRGFDIGEIILSGIVLAIAAVPEGLPAVATIALAIGVKRMAKRHALIRRLASAETLGSVTVICTDKTGTLTKNEPTVREIMLFKDKKRKNDKQEKIIFVKGEGFEPTGKFYIENNDKLMKKNNDISVDLDENQIKNDSDLKLFLKAGTLCNNAELTQEGNQWIVHGDTTEGALIVVSMKMGVDKKILEQENERVWEDPFDSSTRRMTTIHKTSNGKLVAYIKGAVESLLPLCNRIRVDGDIKTLYNEDIESINNYLQEITQKSFRSLLIACKELDKEYGKGDEGKYHIDSESDLILLGIAGIYDPPRQEVKESIEFIKQANIRVVMITGDHPITGKAIAEELKIIDGDYSNNTISKVITGDELEKISVEKLSKEIENISVFARSTPQHKLKIVEALQRNGHIVAMTGDGVNDAPALKQSDIGIAMGKKGTEVAKESADLILLDDNFATITQAIRIGRLIFSNIKKFVEYLFSCNIGELLTMLIAIIVALPFPLLPLQLLWMNLTINIFPALALSAEKESEDSLKVRPPSKKESMISRKEWFDLCIQASIMASTTIGVFYWTLNFSQQNEAQTMAFTTLSMTQTWHALNYSSILKSIIKRENSNINKPLVGAIILSLGLLILVIYLHPINEIFELHPLNANELGIAILLSIICTVIVRIAMEFFKQIKIK